MGSSWRGGRRRRKGRRRGWWGWEGRRGWGGGGAPRARGGRRARRAVEGGGGGGGRPHPGSKDRVEYLRARRKGEVPGNPFGDEGKGAAKAVKASYYVPYVQHTPMEPRA